MKATYNIVFAGKTGTGKSTLINYLYGRRVMKTGVGKSVTPKGFHSVDREINGLSVKLFDSWGLEVGKEKEWMALLDEELKKRDTGKPVEDWFHSVFYCIAASGHRIEDFDTKIIKRFIDNKYNLAVILTKADTISVDDEYKLKDSIQKDLGQSINIIAVCSEEKILRNGIKSERFGKEDVELQAYNNFWDSIVLRLPEHCIKVLEQLIDEWHKNQKKFINEEIGRWNFDEKKQEIDKAYESLLDVEFKKQNTIKSELEKTLKLYGTFARTLNYPPLGSNVTMNLPTEQTDDIKLWEWIYIIPIGIVVWPFMGLDHLIRGKGINRKELLEYIDKLVSYLKSKLGIIESEIEKKLKKLKEDNL
jgi:GTP-binding protein EngB required for normal cell division